MGEDPEALRGDVPFGRMARRDQGKALRKATPRSSHADVIVGQGARDVMSLIEISNSDRVEHLLPVRFGRMAESSLAFFRGSTSLQAYDLKGTPTSGIIVQCCGDCHLMNFGGFATPERKQAFDINDFDETFPAPFEWDVKRLAASFVLAGRWLEFNAADCKRAAGTAVGAYHEHITRYAEMRALEVWYSQITADELFAQFENDQESRQRLQRSLEKAALNTSVRVFNKLTTTERGQVRIVDQPPLLFHLDTTQLELERELVPFFESYRDTLSADRQVLFDRFRLTDLLIRSWESAPWEHAALLHCIWRMRMTRYSCR